MFYTQLIMISVIPKQVHKYLYQNKSKAEDLCSVEKAQKIQAAQTVADSVQNNM